MYNAAVTEMHNREHPKAAPAILTALAAAIFCATSVAQQSWQKLQLPTAAAVQQAWQSPPPEYGPEPYYGLNGPVDQAVIERDLDAMKSLGYTAVTAQAGYGMNEPYLSAAYFKLFRTLVEQARKRNMRVWIVDDAGYPSGFAGGKFSSEHPELRMQALVVAEHIPATGGDIITHAIKPETVAVTAINQADGTTIQVPIASAAIAWKVPPGKWTVVIVEHQFSTSPTRSDTNPKRVKDGTQSLEDYLDPAATAQYLEFTHEQYKKYLGDEFGKTIMGFRGDEPDYSIRGLPWTPKFFDRFQQLKGYDIRPFVATFTTAAGQTAMQLTEQQKRAKADYYDVFSQMFRDGFFKVQGDWCAANHIEYQVHLNHEEAELQLARSEGDFFRAMRPVQVPGIDSIWHQIFPDTISDFPRLASSASHLYGKPRAFTESFAAYRPEPTITDARYVLNEQFVRGINLVETMTTFPAARPPDTATTLALHERPRLSATADLHPPHVVSTCSRWAAPPLKSRSICLPVHSGSAMKILTPPSSQPNGCSPNIKSTSTSSAKTRSQPTSKPRAEPSKPSAEIATIPSSCPARRSSRRLRSTASTPSRMAVVTCSSSDAHRR